MSKPYEAELWVEYSQDAEDLADASEVWTSVGQFLEWGIANRQLSTQVYIHLLACPQKWKS